MKKVALITTNKILAQSFDSAIQCMENLDFELILLLNSRQALLDAEILEIDVALIDIGFIDAIDNKLPEKGAALSFCERLHKRLPNCHLLLLFSQDDWVNRKMATQAKESKIIDDFVFYDASLKYLLAKLSAY